MTQFFARLPRTVLAMIVLTGATLLAGSAALAQQDDRIGTIKTVKGETRIVGAAAPAAAAVGDPVHQNDTLETGKDGALGVTFVDNTTLSLGANSRIVLTKVIFDPDKQNFAFLAKILHGTFMFASGSIARLAPQAVQITTPVSTIGIRGTRFLVEIGE
ncbi:MAG: FecR domain-containing protein [Alphaproteobacteria bacterium]|nr:FecR domain-containing protein [Alphaproteobacteria bacterium]